FAVAHDAEDLVIVSAQLRSNGHAHGNAESLPQRPSGDLHARQLEPMRMALIWRAQAAKQGHVLQRTESCKGEPKIKARRLLAGGTNKPLLAGLRRILW